MLALVAARDRAAASRWTGVRTTFTDLGSGHAQYRAASTAVAAGVMLKLENDTFQAGRVVSGAEALEVMTRLEPLVTRAVGARGR